MKSIQLYLVFSLIILFDSCLEQVRSNGIELTAPLAESGKESALLKSRKRIVPNHKNVHIPTQQIPTLAETDLHQDFINERLKGFFLNKCGQFTNTLFVRYHPSLETGGDYSKTLVCKFGLSSISVH
ncbi:hypothetical protein BLOT_007068 [Blomia tropicalis]|nr:hypothetical protein BLOT_007068 [Blomia tropicalis]